VKAILSQIFPGMIAMAQIGSAKALHYCGRSCGVSPHWIVFRSDVLLRGGGACFVARRQCNHLRFFCSVGLKPFSKASSANGYIVYGRQNTHRPLVRGRRYETQSNEATHRTTVHSNAKPWHFRFAPSRSCQGISGRE
jgi:hypothetical protein